MTGDDDSHVYRRVNGHRGITVVYSRQSTLSMNTRNRILEAADELFYRRAYAA
jgi:AcrR family transcriptional regulator